MSKQNDQKFLEKLMTKFQDTIEKKISAKWEKIVRIIYHNVELGEKKGFIIKKNL
jgi:hypothetical protein